MIRSFSTYSFEVFFVQLEASLSDCLGSWNRTFWAANLTCKGRCLVLICLFNFENQGWVFCRQIVFLNQEVNALNLLGAQT